MVLHSVVSARAWGSVDMHSPGPYDAAIEVEAGV